MARKIGRVRIVDNREFYERVLQIMIPVALQVAINMGVNMLDTMMLGSFGEIQLSASSLANQFYNIFYIANLGIIGGSSVLASQYWGAGEKENARTTFNMAIRLSVLFSLIFALITWFFPGGIMRLYSTEPEVIEQGIRYLRITTFVYLIHGTSLVAAQLMRSVGVVRLGLVVSIVSFVVNIGANYTFIFGKFGAPRMEIAGAALGTLIARSSEFAVTFLYIFLIDQKLQLRPGHLLKSPSSRFYGNFFRLGAPVLLSDFLLGFGSNMISVVLGHMGAVVVASNAVCQVVDRLATVVTQGIGNAAAVITGQTVGAKEYDKAMEQGETFYFLSVVVGCFAAFCVYFLGPLTFKVYNLEPETLVMARQIMGAYAVIALFGAIQSVMTKGVLRGGGEGRHIVLVDCIRSFRSTSRTCTAWAGLAHCHLPEDRLHYQIHMVYRKTPQRQMDPQI